MINKHLIKMGTLLTALFFAAPAIAADLVPVIDDAYYSITNTNPPQIQVVAKGRVPSGGWGFPALVTYRNQKPPAQGVLEYDFIARAPAADRLVIQQEMPIGANNMLHDYYPAIKAIKVNGGTNSITIKVIPPQ